MKTRTDLRMFDEPAQLDRHWQKGKTADEALLSLKESLHAYLDARGAGLRGKAACAAVVTLKIILGPDEGTPGNLAQSLREAASGWAQTWCGSEPLAVRVGPILARHLPGRADRARPLPPGLAIEVVVAPVRPQHHRGRVSGQVVSINKALSELALATLGTGSASRHAEALLASWRAHLAAALPDLALDERPPSAREITREVEDLRERVAMLEEAKARHAEREAELRAFPDHVQAVLALIGDKVIYLSDQNQPVTKRDAELPQEVRSHVSRYKEHYRAVLANPALSPGMRLTLEMTLGEIERIWGTPANDEMPGEAADDDAGDAAGTQPLVDLNGAREAS